MKIVQSTEGDISEEFQQMIWDADSVAWDIETSGLDWRHDRIGTCQLYLPEGHSEIVRMAGSRPDRLRKVLESGSIKKVFHHAAFDLRFMRHHWNAAPDNVACTKILSKIIRPGIDPKEHSLQPTLMKYLGVNLDKGQQNSDWLAPSLSEDQLKYAVRDVEYLLPLFELLMQEARELGVAQVVMHTFKYLPTRIETDLRGCGDVFAY